MRDHGWRAVVVTVVAVLLMAAGCDDGGTTGRRSNGEDAAGRPKLPMSALGGAGGARETSEQAVAGDAAASMIAPQQSVDYRLAGDAEAPAKEAAAYRVVPAGDDRAGEVAKALGVDPAKVEVQAGFGWYYSRDPSGTTSSGVAVACAPDEKCPEPVQPPPPPGVPSASDAESRFRKILEDLGVDTAAGSFEDVPGTVELRSVVFRPRVGGVEIEGLETAIAFGENGRIEYSNGFLGTFEKVGQYPLIDLDEAIARFEKGFGGGVRTMGGAQDLPAMQEDSVSGGSGGSSDPGTAGGSGSEPGKPDEPVMTIEPQPADPTVPLEPQIVEVTGAELVLQMTYGNCPGDDAFLVPAYRFLPAETTGFTVAAVVEESLAGAGADPSKGVEPCPGQTEPDVPVGKPEPAPDVPPGEPEPADRP